MAQASHENGPRRRIGTRGPFDEDRTVDDVKRRVDEFLCRTGLQEYAQHFENGAFLARRPFGNEQVKYLEAQHGLDGKKQREEVHDLDRKLTNTQEGLSEYPEDLMEIRHEYECNQLKREGERRRWYIYIRQNWHVHALILCCSLGAIIQGWDETAINGGMSCFLVAQSNAKSRTAQLYYARSTDFNIEEDHTLIGLLNSAPYLMCIVSCL